MAVEGFDITERVPYDELTSRADLADIGPYERIEGVARYAVDPTLAANAAIVDLALVPSDDDGLVRFSGDVSLLVPLDPRRANRTLLLEVPNRGNRSATRTFDQAPPELRPTARIHPGDGWLFRAGWTVASCGWQWDVPRSPARLGLDAPLVPAAALGPDPGRMQLRFQLHAPVDQVALTDQHVGALSPHDTIAPARLDDPGAELRVGQHPMGPTMVLDRASWSFTGDGAHVRLDGGFRAGLVYDLLYRPARTPVAGAGLLAYRDLGTWLRHSPDAPTAGLVDHVIGQGQSQCGRFLRTFLARGLNVDEAGDQVLDGVHIHIAGGRGGEFDHRWAQPSVQPTPGFGFVLPFTDDPAPDAGHPRGLLDRQRALGGVPRIVCTDTSAEYWRGDASLAHASTTGDRDLAPAPEVRRYLLASSQHGSGFPVLASTSLFGSRGVNPFNIIDHRPLLRAALHNLRSWVAEAIEPPASRIPTVADGTAVTRDQVLGDLAPLAAAGVLGLPDTEALPRLAPLDLGPRATQGVGDGPARVAGPPHTSLVSAIDADGNEVAGVAMPDVTVPVATHTGFEPRHPDTGAAGQILDYLGSTVPFAATEADRRRTGDPRPSLASRYADQASYLEQVRGAADALVAQRLLLAADVELCVALAAARWDLVTAG